MERSPMFVFTDDDPLEETGLFGTKEIIALALCGVETVGAFAALDLTAVKHLRGYGEATRRRLEKLQRRLRTGSDVQASSEGKR